MLTLCDPSFFKLDMWNSIPGAVEDTNGIMKASQSTCRISPGNFCLTV